MEIQIKVNGKVETVKAGLTVLAYLEGRGVKPEQVAVAHNSNLLQRDEFVRVILDDGDTLEILRAMAGGAPADGDKFILGERKLTSRLLLGTGKFPSRPMIAEAIRESGAQVVTVALRRIDFDAPEEDNVLSYIDKECILLPNTSGARNAEEAVQIAEIARAAGCGNWVKIEVVVDNKYLLPDNYETLKATEILAKKGFVVLPYMSPDLMVARQLESAGAAAVMPLGAPIGSNRGLKTRELVRILVDEIKVPVIVDAGLGKPSDAAECMELGCEAVLVNTAIATAENPPLMAKAFALAVEAGRKAFLAGMGAEKEHAEASSPLTGFLWQ